ncbi:MAG: hypothetical protein RMJ35_11240, partial [Phycisphaerales bacterium]|nr:hypothetical protein [Phycisphaerales bacterium]
SQPQRAAEIIRQIGPARQERQRIADKYAALLQQNTPQSRDMNGVLKFFDEQFGRYDAAVKGYAAEAPGRVQSHVEEALKMAGDAIADRNHLYFKEDGGVAQRLGWAQTRVDLLAAIDPDSAETRQARQLLENARQQVAQLKSQLTDDIIAANRPLDDRYQGPDRGQILALIQEKWEKEGNGAQVLKVAVNGDQWQRTTRWDWSSANKAWQKVDYSSLQGYLIVKDTDTQAVAHYINVKRDHLANDRLTAWFLSDPRETPDLGNRFLIENLK